MHGEPALAAGFSAFGYVNASAPKGGRLTEGIIGTFDSLNPFIVKGLAVSHVRGYVVESLMTRGYDEPFTLYGLLAKSVETDAERTYVTFALRPEGRFSDGRPVTAEDVIFSWQLLRDKGRPNYRTYYAKVAKAEVVGPAAVRFDLTGAQDRELPLILGLMPVLPKHTIDPNTFEETSFVPLVGSGPYVLTDVDPGRSVRLKRDPAYWGRDLPVNRGFWNFDEIRIDYYRDANSHFEAFKTGLFDVITERDPSRWESAYDVPAVRDGLLIKKEFRNDRPAGMQGYAFNLRRPLFQDRRVREALGYAFDFEWSNRTLFYGQYTRSRSYFDNSELAANGVPSGAELQVLEPFRDKLPPEVFTKEYQPPATDGSGNMRDNLRKAAELLKAAGWSIDPNTKKLVNAQGQPFEFEILLVDPAYERVTLPFVKNLERLGVTAHVRTVDSAQYKKRTDDFDFDMVMQRWLQSLSPGNEQRAFWGSAYADQPGSPNIIGLKDPVVDALVEQIVSAPDRASLIARTHALDRVLQWGFYVVPNWYIGYDRIAYWDKFGIPAVIPSQGVQIDAWWVDAAKAAALAQRRGGK